MTSARGTTCLIGSSGKNVKCAIVAAMTFPASPPKAPSTDCAGLRRGASRVIRAGISSEDDDEEQRQQLFSHLGPRIGYDAQGNDVSTEKRDVGHSEDGRGAARKRAREIAACQNLGDQFDDDQSTDDRTNEVMSSEEKGGGETNRCHETQKVAATCTDFLGQCVVLDESEDDAECGES